METSHPYKFRLYITGNCPNSLEAVFNLQAFCIEHLPKSHEIEIVDVLLDPDRALADGILLTPLLLKLNPEPPIRIVGSLSQSECILETLGLSRDTTLSARTDGHDAKVRGRYSPEPRQD